MQTRGSPDSSACDLTFHPGDRTVATGTHYRAASETGGAIVSTLPLLHLLLAVRQPHVLDFYSFHLLFSLPLFFFSSILDELTIGEDV